MNKLYVNFAANLHTKKNMIKFEGTNIHIELPQIAEINSHAFEGANNVIDIDLGLIPTYEARVWKSGIDFVNAIIANPESKHTDLFNHLYWQIKSGRMSYEHFQISIVHINDLNDSKTLIRAISRLTLQDSDYSHVLYCLPFFQVLRDLMEWEYEFCRVKTGLFSFGEKSRNKNLFFELQGEYIHFLRMDKSNNLHFLTKINQSEVMVHNRMSSKKYFANVLANIFENIEDNENKIWQ